MNTKTTALRHQSVLNADAMAGVDVMIWVMIDFFFVGIKYEINIRNL